MKVIGFTGLPGSGKTTAIDAVRDLGVSISMGDVIRNENQKLGLEPTDENLGNTARDLRAKGGKEIIARKCIEMINELNEEVVYIDGIRSYLEVQIFKESWKFPLIAIATRTNERFERLNLRARHDDPNEMSDLKERDAREIGFGVMEAIKNADFTIDNESRDIKELKKKSRKIVLKILENY